MTEKELLAGPLVRNLRLLTRYRLLRTDARLLTALEANVRCEGTTLANLANSRDVSMTVAETRLHIFHLLAVGRLSFDPRSRPLDDKTRILPGGAVTWNPFDSVLSGYPMRQAVEDIQRCDKIIVRRHQRVRDLSQRFGHFMPTGLYRDGRIVGRRKVGNPLPTIRPITVVRVANPNHHPKAAF